MKNIVYVDIDTDREDQPVRIGKPSDFQLPETTEKDQEVTQLDLKSLIEGALLMGIYMENQGYQSFDDTLDGIVEQMKEGYEDIRTQEAIAAEEKRKREEEENRKIEEQRNEVQENLARMRKEVEDLNTKQNTEEDNG
jgi:hypothetical protein